MHNLDMKTSKDSMKKEIISYSHSWTHMKISQLQPGTTYQKGFWELEAQGWENE